MQRVGGPRSYQAFCGRIEQLPGDQWEKPRSSRHTGRGRDISRGEPMQYSGRRIYFGPKRWIDGGTFGSVRRTPRSCDHLAHQVATETRSTLQSLCKDKGVQCRRPSTMEGNGEHAGYERWEVSPHLGRALQDYCYCRSGGLLLGGSGRKTTSPAVECPQLKEVLPLTR